MISEYVKTCSIDLLKRVEFYAAISPQDQQRLQTDMEIIILRMLIDNNLSVKGKE